MYNIGNIRALLAKNFNSFFFFKLNVIVNLRENVAMTKTSFIFFSLKIFSVVKRMNERINPRNCLL